jgi:hypothetical protein
MYVCLSVAFFPATSQPQMWRFLAMVRYKSVKSVQRFEIWVLLPYQVQRMKENGPVYKYALSSHMIVVVHRSYSGHLSCCCPGLRLAQAGGPTHRFSVPFSPVLPEEWSFRNIIIYNLHYGPSPKEPFHTRQPAWPEVIVGTDFCNNGNRSHCWHLLLLPSESDSQFLLAVRNVTVLKRLHVSNLILFCYSVVSCCFCIVFLRLSLSFYRITWKWRKITVDSR